MRPTPRTDALVKVVLGEEVCAATEMKDHARTLERELAEAVSLIQVIVDLDEQDRPDLWHRQARVFLQRMESK